MNGDRQPAQGSLFDAEKLADQVREKIGATEVRFNGSDYIPSKDDVRLTGQILRIFDVMQDGKWRTLSEIEIATGDPQASISAQLRHLRKERFGAHTLNRRSRGDRELGLYEYQLVLNRGQHVTG